MTTGVDTTAAFERFLKLMLRADRRTATREAVALVESGMPLADFVLEILAPVRALRRPHLRRLRGLAARLRHRDQLVAAMLSTLHERLAIDVPSVDLPLHAASLALA